MGVVPWMGRAIIIIIIIIIITSQYKLQEIKHNMIHVYENRFKSSIGGQPRSSLNSKRKRKLQRREVRSWRRGETFTTRTRIMKGTQTFRIKILKEVRPEERFDMLYEDISRE